MEQMEHKEIVARLAALAHESRLSVYRMLVQRGPEGLTPGVMAEQLGLAPSSLSFHLKELAHADLVSIRQEGRKLVYAANFSVMNTLMAYLSENCCGGNPCTPLASAGCGATGPERKPNAGDAA
jgi:DNA-binding transcriptional ArsR family regulator